MDRDALREFAGRRWREAAALDRRYWAERHRREGAAATIGASEVLRAHMRRLRPDWPTAADRAADFSHHVELKKLLERAAGVFAAR